MNTAYNYLDLEPKAGMKVVTHNSGSGTPTGTSIEDSERSPQIIPGQKSSSGKSRSVDVVLLRQASSGWLNRSFQKPVSLAYRETIDSSAPRLASQGVLKICVFGTRTATATAPACPVPSS